MESDSEDPNWIYEKAVILPPRDPEYGMEPWFNRILVRLEFTPEGIKTGVSRPINRTKGNTNHLTRKQRRLKVHKRRKT